MTLAEAIPFAVSGVVLVWAAASAALAFAGGQASGMHHIAPPAERPAVAPRADGPPRPRRRPALRAGGWMMIARIGNYLLAFGVLGAVTLMLIGVALYGEW
ncbi:MAG: hypothetical protein WD734_06140 [Dehalococcoidia bacterium]